MAWRDYNPKRKLVRKSDNHFTETTIQPQMRPDKLEYNVRSFFKGANGETQNLTELEVSNKWGMGVSIEIRKIGKRTSSMSFQIGADQVDVLFKYLQKIRPELGNYSGEIITDY